MFAKQYKSLVALLIILAFVVAGCGGAPAKAPEKPAAAPTVDAVAVTKEATWDAYKKVVADNQAKTFPLDGAKAKELYQGNESKYLVIDMRAPEDYAKGHVKGAVNLPIGMLASNLDKLPTDKTLMLYCYTGQTTALAMVPLKALGYKAVSITKGFPTVEQAGFAIDTVAVEFKAGAARVPADPKEAAIQAGVIENFSAIAKQAAAKTLIIKGSDAKDLVAAAPDKYTIVDLRSAEDFDKAHVKGSINIPLAQLKDKAPTLAKDKTVILYCYSGQTAAMATAPLKAEGFKLASITTGFGEAEKGGFAIEKK